MNEIKFNRYYQKLYEQTSAELIAVRPISYKDINTVLAIYDTSFYEKGSLFFRKFEVGNYIQLIFLGNYHIPFCTIRKDDEEGKLEFYRDNIGEQFKIVIDDKPTLKNCPFCGRSKSLSVERRIENGSPETFAVYCWECFTEGPFGYTQEEAIYKWNNRD